MKLLRPTSSLHIAKSLQDLDAAESPIRQLEKDLIEFLPEEAGIRKEATAWNGWSASIPPKELFRLGMFTFTGSG